MRDDLLNILGTSAPRQKIMMNIQKNFPANLQFGIDQQVQSVRHDSFGRVLYRHHAARRASLPNLLKDVVNADRRNESCRGAEFLPCGEMRIARFDAKKSNFQRRLEGAASSNDFAKNGTNCLFGKRTAA